MKIIDNSMAMEPKTKQIPTTKTTKQSQKRTVVSAA